MFFLVVGFELATSVVIGLFVGSYFDKKLNFETPYLTLFGLILGVLVGFTFLIRLLKIKNNNDE